jgi:hypothetical protein
MTRKIKKSDTFDDKDQWKVDKTVRKEIMIAIERVSDNIISEETIDDIIVALESLNYLEFKGV